ncbi:hypothetical protein ACEWY4_017303 [Coilia grayii]|uniref:Immunoglobulin domain-containing protein n=1 Tax=Coilia grayii TaxID=363190 RepID=A0ABD1JHI6_9TELE
MRLYLIILCVLSVLGGVKAEPISVTATEGDNADIHCSAALAHGNDKYFCKDPCEDDHHVLVSTKKHAQPPGKYSLVDHGYGSFTVTIYHVEFSDSGIYYCGVDRSLKDTLQKVILDVIARPTQPDYRLTSVYTPLTAPLATTDYDYDYDYDKGGVVLAVCISVGVVALLMVLLISAGLYTRTRKRARQPTDHIYANTAHVSHVPARPDDDANIYQSLQTDASRDDVYHTLHRL